MSAGTLARTCGVASARGNSHPQGIDYDKEPAAGVWNTALRSKRSWYSQTFSDDESDDQNDESSLALASAAADVFIDAAHETCHTREDANSDASTDVGSDDEGTKCLEDFEMDEARSRPGSTKAASSSQPYIDQPQQVAGEMACVVDLFAPEHLENEVVPASKKQMEPDELEAMAQRRLLKKQRQRQERREQRVQDRAERTARRKRPARR